MRPVDQFPAAGMKPIYQTEPIMPEPEARRIVKFHKTRKPQFYTSMPPSTRLSRLVWTTFRPMLFVSFTAFAVLMAALGWQLIMGIIHLFSE